MRYIIIIYLKFVDFQLNFKLGQSIDEVDHFVF